MSNKNFPEFGNQQTGPYVESLKNYALPDFILKLVAKECDSELAEKGRIDKKLQSMNKSAIELLYKIFVKCDKDNLEKYAEYRFYAFVSSMYHKCEVLLNEKIQGASGKNHRVPVAIKENEMYISIAFKKDKEKQVTKKDTIKFYDIVDDIKKGVYGTQLTDAIYCSSGGFKGEAVVNLESLSNKRAKNPEEKINFKIANFENRIYSLVKQ
ncbi:MAG TPA: hypothetical protein VMW74_00725 [Nitrosopumilaceae archaeon]|nr:hypothetical protein [Nitrosopumilaceae archaeon]